MKKLSEEKLKVKRRRQFVEESNKDINTYKHDWKKEMEEEYYDDLTFEDLEEKFDT